MLSVERASSWATLERSNRFDSLPICSARDVLSLEVRKREREREKGRERERQGERGRGRGREGGREGERGREDCSPACTHLHVVLSQCSFLKPKPKIPQL